MLTVLTAASLTSIKLNVQERWSIIGRQSEEPVQNESTRKKK